MKRRPRGDGRYRQRRAASAIIDGGKSAGPSDAIREIMARIRIFAELLAAAATGAALAALANFAVARERSLLRRAAEAVEWTAAALGPAPDNATPVVFALALLTAFGGLSILYARPLGRKGALACGVCAIAVLALFLP